MGAAVYAPATGKSGGRPRSVDLRRVVNGLFYLVRSGCAWRYLPRDYGPWSTVYHFFGCGAVTASGNRCTRSCGSRPGDERDAS